MNQKKPTPKKNQRKRRRKSVFRLALEVYDRIEKIHRELVRRRSGTVDATELPLTLAPKLHCGEDAEGVRKAFAVSLLDQLAEDAAAKQETDAAFVFGRVYCYWCDSALCEHAIPDASLTVFSGYSQTGQPCWDELSACFLRLDGDRVHMLHRQPPMPITLMMDGRGLHAQQLTIFGGRSKRFKVLHQAAVGYLPCGDPADPRKLALTLQIVQAAPQKKKPQLALNVIGTQPDGRPIADAIDARENQRLADLVDAGRLHLAELSKQRPSAERSRRLRGCIKHIASGIEKIFRQKSRRTKHAEHRHQDRTRPTGAALKDVKKADRRQFYRDQRKGTFLIIGPRCRTHFFNEQGHHITSIMYRGEDIDRLIQTTQWKALPEPDVEGLREKILGSSRSADE